MAASKTSEAAPPPIFRSARYGVPSRMRGGQLPPRGRARAISGGGRYGPTQSSASTRFIVDLLRAVRTRSPLDGGRRGARSSCAISSRDGQENSPQARLPWSRRGRHALLSESGEPP